jgi:hypothetical protein
MAIYCMRPLIPTKTMLTESTRRSRPRGLSRYAATNYVQTMSAVAPPLDSAPVEYYIQVVSRAPVADPTAGELAVGTRAGSIEVV